MHTVFPTFVAALALASVHLVAGKLHTLGSVPRSRWLSFAGGVSVAYVFVHLLPDLAAHRDVLGEITVFLVALAGLVACYGLERLALAQRATEKHASGDAVDADEEPGVFFVHLGSFTLYNLLVGYLLVRGEPHDMMELALYTVAMGLHFLVNDFGLRDHYKADYRSPGRWLLAGAAVAGWGLGFVANVSETLTGGLFAFLAGGVVLNVLKEELPERRQSRFWPFLLGVAGYTALLLVA